MAGTDKGFFTYFYRNGNFIFFIFFTYVFANSNWARDKSMKTVHTKIFPPSMCNPE